MKKIAIIGASHAGVSCADKLRQYGFKGALILIDRLPGLPVQRPPLSKNYPNPSILILQLFICDQKSTSRKKI